jgi:hypothetical protein
MTVIPEISTPPSEASIVAAPGSYPGVSPETDLIPLRAAFGQDEASHGTARYAIYDDGLIQVPMEAVGPLTATGGFTLGITKSAPISVGMIDLHHEDAGGCSYGGRQYLGDANGDVSVPTEAISELLAHGFVPVFRAPNAVSSRTKSPPRNRSKRG